MNRMKQGVFLPPGIFLVYYLLLKFTMCHYNLRHVVFMNIWIALFQESLLGRGDHHYYMHLAKCSLSPIESSWTASLRTLPRDSSPFLQVCSHNSLWLKCHSPTSVCPDSFHPAPPRPKANSPPECFSGSPREKDDLFASFHFHSILSIHSHNQFIKTHLVLNNSYLCTSYFSYCTLSSLREDIMSSPSLELPRKEFVT